MGSSSPIFRVNIKNIRNHHQLENTAFGPGNSLSLDLHFGVPCVLFLAINSEPTMGILINEENYIGSSV